MAARLAKAVLVLTAFWACLGNASAQTSAEDVQVSFGFAGEIVADAWNPLRVTLRDVQDAELRLSLDVGSLRRGPVRLSYRAPLPGGPGLTTFEDDLYLPSWVSFAWTLTTPAGVLAEGEVSRYAADPEPLQLVLAYNLGAGGAYFSPAARVVEIAPSDLPERAAAYDGVESLLVLPGTAPPEAAALVAAAGAGADVLLSAGLGPSFAAVSALAGTGTRVVGAGTLVRLADRTGLEAGLRTSGRLEPDLLAATLTGNALTEPPTGQDGGPLALRLAAYAAAVALLLRFGGPPGVLAALLLAGTLSLAAWRTRPAEPLLLRSRSLALSAGGLALRTDLEHLFSFPGQAASVPHPARPLATVVTEETDRRFGVSKPIVTLPATEPESVGTTDYRVGPERFEIDLDAYGSTLLIGKPRLEPAVLEWSDGVLVNRGAEPLTDVFVTWGGDGTPEGAVGTVGRGGRQADLEPEGTLTVASGNLMPPELYEGLTPFLPPGSAVARGGGTVYVALPEEPNPPNPP